MFKKIVSSGLLAWVVLIVWGFVVNGLFSFNSRINMKQIPEESQVYEVLKESFVEPGRYIINPETTSEGMFPDGEPVFSIYYSGMGHESAGKVMLFKFAIFLLVSMLGTWMLSLSSQRILSSYPRKVLYFAMIGLLFGLFSNLLGYGIDAYPFRDALLMAIHDIVLWILMGLVVAWRFSPEPVSMKNPQAGKASR